MGGGTGIEAHWVARPWIGRALRVAARGAPYAVGAAAAAAAGHWFPPPAGNVRGFVFWSFVVTVIVGGLTVIADRVARRLLPFAFLLRLGLVFPDRVPSRFSLALRANPVRDLERRWSAPRGEARQIEPAALLGLVAQLTAHDRSTRGHSERVRAFTELLGQQLDLDADDLVRLRWAALLHDVGKCAIPREVLHKLGVLDSDDIDLIRQHPAIGRHLIEPVAAWLGPWAHAIEEHHERWDGTGYPRRVAGERISLAARIVAVADAYEVMVTGRPYQARLDEEAARKELVRCAGKQFDPAIVRAFLLIPVRKLRWATGLGTWLGELPLVPGLRVAARAAAVTGVGTAAALGASPGTREPVPAVVAPHTATASRPAVIRIGDAVVDAAVMTNPLLDGRHDGEGPRRRAATTSTTNPTLDPASMAPRLPAIVIPDPGLSDAPERPDVPDLAGADDPPKASGLPAGPPSGMPDPATSGSFASGLAGTWVAVSRRKHKGSA